MAGENVFKIVAPATRKNLAMDCQWLKRYMVRQQPNVHVSDVLKQPTEFRTKDGTILWGVASIQFFYNDEGNVSFDVSSISPMPTFAPQL